MTVRQVALDRDMRAARIMPPVSSLISWHFVRRTLGVAGLLGIDLGAFFVALLMESVVSGATGLTLWPGLSRVGLAGTCGTIVVCAAVGGLYGPRHLRHRARRILSMWTITFVISSVLLLLLNPDSLGARFVAVWLAAALLSLWGRWVLDWLLAVRYGTDGDCPRALVLGTRDACVRALSTLAVLPSESRMSVAGLVVPGDQGDGPFSPSADAPPVVAAQGDLSGALKRCRVSQVVIADLPSLNGQLRSVMDACRRGGVTLKVVSADLVRDDAAVTHIPGMECPIFVLRPKPANLASYLTKRIVDRVGAVLLLIILSPLLIAVALSIKFSSCGPVLFADWRVGLAQRPFRCYKFRTMVVDASQRQAALESCNEADGALFKIKEDPRVTGVGRVLRRFSLDELPQLLNVANGEMSLVGPRPLPMRDCELLEEWHWRRHVVLPGITGLWQVSGRSDLRFEDMVELDTRYIETWNLLSDVTIAWRTASAVFRSRGAY